MNGSNPDFLSAGELAALERLRDDLRRALARARRLTARLTPARRLSVRALVRDRLLCVIHDSLAAAGRDLDAIEADAREPRSPRCPR